MKSCNNIYISYKYFFRRVFMKLVFAIISDQDTGKLIKELNKNSFIVTKLSSTGGFLRSGNTTLLMGIDESRLNNAIAIIKKNSKTRKQLLDSTVMSYGMESMISTYHDDVTSSPSLSPTNLESVDVSYPVEILLGGATIFVLNVERTAKV